MPLAWLLAATLWLAPAQASAQAQWTANGVPVCVLPLCGGVRPAITSDGNGGALIAWQQDLTGDNENIFMRRVLSTGAIADGWPPSGTPVTRAPGNQYISGLVPDGQAGAFVVWYDWPNYDIYAQHVLGNGQIAPGWPPDGLPVSVGPRVKDSPRMLADGAGGVFVIWYDGETVTSGGDIYAQHLDGDGIRVAGWPEGGLALCTDPEEQGNPHIAGDGAGGIIAVWGDVRSNGPFGAKIYGTRVSESGEFAPGWPVNGREIVGGAYGHFIRHMVSDGAGGAYIGWDFNFGPFAFEDDVYAIRMLGDGSIAPGWPPGGYPVSARADAQYLTGMVMDGTGGALLAWYDSLEQPSVVFVQRLGPESSPALGWPASGVRASNLLGWQVIPRLAPNGNGGAYVAMEIDLGGGFEGFVQHLLADGTRAPGWPASAIPLVNDPTGTSGQQDPAINSDGRGGAIVTWDDSRDGHQSKIYAQRYFGDGPTPVLVSLVSVEALPDRVTLTWHDAGRTLTDAAVHRRGDGEAWVRLGPTTFDGTGRARFEDREAAAGTRYAYRLGWIEADGERFSGEAWVEVPRALTLALEGARPNPASGPLQVAFALPQSAPATLELLDVAGRQVLAREVGSLGPGQHVIRLGECGCTPPGIYWLRLTQAGRQLTRRAVIVR